LPKYDEELLFFLASQAGLQSGLKTSTAKISASFGGSQQTASRKLRELSQADLVELNATPTGCIVRIKKKGADLLHQRLVSLQRLFNEKKKAQLQGIVKSGLGEGRYYVSRQPYLQQFKKLLGFKPFFGTLNLVVDQNQLQGFLFGLQSIQVKGFETDERSFGTITAFKVVLQGKQEAAMVFPERTTHPKNEIELISPSNLRKKLKLKDGSKVFVKHI